MATDVADLLLRIDATTEGLRRELKKAESAVQGGARQIDKSTKQIDKRFESMGMNVSKAIGTVVRAAAAMGAALSVREVIKYADAWQNATNQLKTVQKETEDLAVTQNKLMQVSNDTRSGFESTANLYTRLSRATEALNLTQDELIDLTGTINQSFAVSGATATEAANAITQLSQGLAAGALRGEEFNSISEQSPILLDAIGKSLRMSRGELRAFAADGGITSEVIVKALKESAGSIDETFGKMTATFGQNMQVAQNNLLAFVGSADMVQGAAGTAGAGIAKLSEHLDDVGKVAGIVAGIFAARFTASVVVAGAAQATAMAQSMAYQAALARMAGVSAVAAASQTALAAASTAASRALMMIGGPVGAALIAAAGAYYLIDALIELRAQSYRLAGDDFAKQSLDAMSLSAEQASANILSTKDRMSLLRAELASASEIYGENSKEANALNRQLDLQQNWLNLNKLRLGELNAQVEKNTRNSVAFTDKTIDMVDALEAQMKALYMTEREQAVFSAGLKAIANGDGPDAIATVERLAGEYYDANESLNQWNDSIDEYLKEQEDARKAAERNKESIAETIAKLEQEQQALGMSARAQAIFNATIAAANNPDALPAEIANIAELTAVNYDLAASSGAAEKAATEAAEKSKKAWENTHDYLSGAFVDLMNNGGNAFDNIAKAFERTVQRMVAEWAASGLMGMFAGGGLSGFSIGGGGLGGIASTIGGLFGGASKGGVVGEIAKGGVGGLAGAGGAASAGGGVLGALGAVPGWGWALAAGGLAAAALGNKSTPSANAGMLIRPVGDGDRQFDVPAFASGFDPVGFARREDQGVASQVIDVFRADDAALTALAKASGINVSYNANNFGGFNEKGNGNGLFFGTANEDGSNTAVPIDQQRTQFVSQWIKGLSGKVDQSLIQDVLGQSSADAMILRAAQLAGVDGSHANGLNRVPFDGYRAALHTNEEVLTASDPRNQNNGGGMIADMKGMIAEMRQVAFYTKRTSDLLLRVTRDGESLVTVTA